MASLNYAITHLLGLRGYLVALPHDQWVRGDVVDVAEVGGRIHVLLESAVLLTPAGDIPINRAWIACAAIGHHQATAWSSTWTR